MNKPSKQYGPEVTRIKERNKLIFNETTDAIRRGWYTAPSGAKISFDTTNIDDGAVCYHQELAPVAGKKVDGGTTVIVEKGDCLVAAKRLVEEGFNPALLNFASAGHPGGGVETGARAQEETICRRSTLTRSIYTFDANFAKRYGYPHHEGANYPLDNLDFSAVYSPGITVFREGKECIYMEHPYRVAVITCAALNLNGRYRLKLTPNKQMPEEAVAITRNKVRTIFRIGLLHGHDALVLGAFGCGAFKNPPEEIAAIFHEILEEPEFKDRYRLVTFSIIEDHNSNDQNLNAFKNEFSDESLARKRFIKEFVDIFPSLSKESKEKMAAELEQHEIDMQTVTEDEKRFRSILETVGREGTEELLQYLKFNDFFTAPASVYHHSNWKGGLVNHSLKVYDLAMQFRVEMIQEDPSLVNGLKEENIAVAALLHDICKLDEYTILLNGKPSHKEPRANLGGHGYKSAVLIMFHGFKLTGDELLAIRWHMGAKRINDQKEKEECEKAKKDSALVRLIIKADHEAARG